MRSQLVEEVSKELERQQNLWGLQLHSDAKWYVILMEEIGEIARGMNEHDHDNMREEIIQSIAVMINWLDTMDGAKVGGRNEGGS